MNHTHSLLPESASIRVAMETLYLETDIALPSMEYPITPLGPLMKRLPVVIQEMPELTSRRILAHLLNIGALETEEEFGEVSQEPMAGFFFACGQYAWIYVRADDPIARKRFSAAHELGHYWLHFRPLLTAELVREDEPPAWRDDFAEAQATETEEGNENRIVNETQIYARQEREANNFAAELLMPETVVKSLYNYWKERLRGRYLKDRLAETLLVSKQAMGIRLKSLGLKTGGTEEGE